MSTRAEATAVRHEVVVAAPIERAFSVFTDDFGAFKPREHNMLSVDIAETIFEPRRRPPLRPRRRRQRVPLGAHPCLRAAEPRRVQLGHQPAMAGRNRPAEDQ